MSGSTARLLRELAETEHPLEGLMDAMLGEGWGASPGPIEADEARMLVELARMIEQEQARCSGCEHDDDTTTIGDRR